MDNRWVHICLLDFQVWIDFYNLIYHAQTDNSTAEEGEPPTDITDNTAGDINQPGLEDSTAEFADPASSAAEDTTGLPEDGERPHSDPDANGADGADGIEGADAADSTLDESMAAVDSMAEDLDEEARAAHHRSAVTIQTASRGRLARQRVLRIRQGAEDPFAGAAAAASAGGSFEEVKAAARPTPRDTQQTK